MRRKKFAKKFAELMAKAEEMGLSREELVDIAEKSTSGKTIDNFLSIKALQHSSGNGCSCGRRKNLKKVPIPINLIQKMIEIETGKTFGQFSTKKDIDLHSLINKKWNTPGVPLTSTVRNKILKAIYKELVLPEDLNFLTADNQQFIDFDITLEV